MEQTIAIGQLITFQYNINTKLNILITVIQKLRLPIPQL